MAEVVLATCADYPHGDKDAALLTAALSAGGVPARWQVWDDPAASWSGALTVLRCTWDYTLRREDFLAWAGTVTRLANPVDVVVWNSDKTYLGDLAEAGVPVVPTTSARPGEPVRIPDDGEFVVKPSVGAGSRGAGRFGSEDHAAAHAHARSLHEAGRVVLVQPYLADVDTSGESALIYFDGSFSHAVRKGPMLPKGTAHTVHSHALFIAENITARSPSPAERRVGEQALRAIRERFGADLLYARIDLLPSPDGPVVVELELIEPSLFLIHSAGAAERFAAAIAARA